MVIPKRYWKNICHNFLELDTLIGTRYIDFERKLKKKTDIVQKYLKMHWIKWSYLKLIFIYGRLRSTYKEISENYI